MQQTSVVMPRPRRTKDEARRDFFVALGALQRLYSDAAVFAPYSARHATLQARYEQALRLLLADSPDIRTPPEDD